MSKKESRILGIQKVLIAMIMILCTAVMCLAFIESLLALPGDRVPQASMFAMIGFAALAVLLSTAHIFLRFLREGVVKNQAAKKKAGRARRPFTRY